MSNFIHDWLTLLAGKTDRQAITAPANQVVRAAEYNALVAAVNDIRTECWDGGVNVLSLGADRTGALDASPSINQAIQSMRTGERNGRVYLPPGRYRLSAPLVIESAMILQGAGGMFSQRGTVLLPDVGVTAIILAKGSSAVHTGGDASWCSVRDLFIFGPESYHAWDGAVADGVVINANGCEIHNVSIQNMQRHGIAVTSPSGANANCTKIHGATIYYCGGDGIYFQGGDTNAGETQSCSVTGCGGSGLHDASFLGNLHERFHTEANEVHAFFIEGSNNLSHLVSCYSESDQTSSIAYNALVTGGDHGAPISGGCTIDLGIFRNQLRVSELIRATVPGTHTFAGFSESVPRTWALNDTIAGSVEEISTSELGVITRRPHACAYHRNFLSTYVDTEAHTGQLVAGQRALLVPTAAGDTVGQHPIAPGRIVFPEGAHLGVSRVTSRYSVPSEGDWNIGDVCYNRGAVAGQPEGWRCVAGGTFGTYSEGRTATTTGGVAAVVLNAPSSILLPGQWISIGGNTRRILPSARWTPSTAVANDIYVDCYRTAHGNLYRLVTNGTTGTTGPTGTTWTEADGSAVWAYCGPADRTFWLSAYFPTGGPGQTISYQAPVFQPFGLVHGAPAGTGLSGIDQIDVGVAEAGTVLAVAAAAQISIHELAPDASADVTITSAPVIAAAGPARRIIVRVVIATGGAHTITLQSDNGTSILSGLKLASGADFVGAGGDCLEVQLHQDGYWYETFRRVAGT